MIRLYRLDPPQVLTDNAAQWTAEFVASGEKRPKPKRYGHPEVKRVLVQISHHKCFYCEQGVAEGDGEVDHRVDVSTAPERAYDWTNLYWSCETCNNKRLREGTVPVASVLDPTDPDVDPAEHLLFDAEKVLGRAGSELGAATIRKYRLDRMDLELARGRAITQVLERWIELESLNLDRERRIELIREWFVNPARPFSAALRAYVDRRWGTG